jgi:hypothetical protein
LAAISDRYKKVAKYSQYLVGEKLS